MKISECTHGKIVKYKNADIYGMIVSIEENLYREPIPVVKWQDEEKPVGIHPCNIEPAQ